MRITSDQRRLIGEGFATVAQAVEYLAISKPSVYDLIHAGILSHGKFAGKFVIPWVAVKSYVAQRLKMGSTA